MRGVGGCVYVQNRKIQLQLQLPTKSLFSDRCLTTVNNDTDFDLSGSE